MNTATNQPTPLTDFEEFLIDLYDDGGIKVNLGRGFSTVASRGGGAPPTPLYFNFRHEGYRDGSLADEDYVQIADFFMEMIQKEGILFDVIAAVPRAGDKLAGSLVRRMGGGIDLLTFDKESYALYPHKHKKGLRVLLIDDVISNGKSKEPFVRALQAAGYTVVVLVLVDRGQGGKEFLTTLGAPLFALTTAQRFLSALVQTNRLGESDARKIASRMWG